MRIFMPTIPGDSTPLTFPVQKLARRRCRYLDSVSIEALHRCDRCGGPPQNGGARLQKPLLLYCPRAGNFLSGFFPSLQKNLALWIASLSRQLLQSASSVYNPKGDISRRFLLFCSNNRPRLSP